MKYTYKEFQQALKIVNAYKFQLQEHYKKVSDKCVGISKFSNVTKETKIMEVQHLEIRIKNCLIVSANADYNTKIKDLDSVSMKHLLRMRNFGKGSLNDLKELFFYAGVKLLP